jgi:exoribonuclease R
MEEQKFKVLFTDGKSHLCSLPDFKDSDLNIDISVHKLFFNDVFSFFNNSVTLIHSSVRSSSDIPGILILEGNKTYGRKKHKLLYKCIPDDTRLQPFLIPYEFKHMDFSKAFMNLYVTFSFESWEDKHPHGILTQVLGKVSELESFYEYQLYCKSLNASFQHFQKETNKALKDKSDISDFILQKFPFLENRIHDFNIFSIDPKGSMDKDDAFSIKQINNSLFLLSVYVANVPLWIESLNLWESFSRRIATIYLPDKKRPMLPNMLSDNLCSLLKDQLRIAFYMDIFIDIEKEDIQEIKYGNCFVKLKENFGYDQPELQNCEDYIHALKITKTILPKYKYVCNIRDSHDLIAYLMVLMNYYSAESLLKFDNGIFRSSVFMKKDIDKDEIKLAEHLPETVSNYIRKWRSSYGQYLLLDSENKLNIRHVALNVDAYVHITSPIRRLVDLLNLVQMQKNLKLFEFSESANLFYNKWIKELDYINTTMRSIRRVQSDCDLLALCYKNPEVLEKIYDGYMFDNIPRNDGLFQYIVYLPELMLTSRITLVNNIENYTCMKFKIFIFEDEDKLKKKIRLQILSNN